MSKEAKKIIKNLEDSLGELEDKIEILSKPSKQKGAKKIKNKLTCQYEIQETKEFSKKKFYKKVKEFFIENSKMEEGEIFYIVTAYIDNENKLQTYGAYYGMEMSPLSFRTHSDSERGVVFLSEGMTRESMLEFIDKIKNNKMDECLYAFKVEYTNFKLCNMKSLYGGELDLSLYMFEREEDSISRFGKVVKKFGRVDYSPSINSFR